MQGNAGLNSGDEARPYSLFCFTSGLISLGEYKAFLSYFHGIYDFCNKITPLLTEVF
jgi:hypothetical protein